MGFQQTPSQQPPRNTFQEGLDVVTVPPGPVPDVQRLHPGEQRQVAILFVELVDLFSLAEVLNPDEMSRVLDRVYTVFTGVVASFGGWVDRSDDGLIMALFGNRSATEKDPERAIRAALEMFDRLQQINRYLGNRSLHLEIRAGLHIGMVVVGEDGVVTSGDAVAVAAGLDGAAPVNTLLISKKARDLVGDTFLYEHVGTIHLKNRRTPVDTFRVVGLNPREEGRWLRSSLVRRAQFVGRERELRVLQQAWDHAREPARWRVATSHLMGSRRAIQPFFVAFKGPAGTGKSRLVHEFLASLTHEGQQVRVLSGRADPLSRESYGLFVALLKDFASIEDEDIPTMRRRKLEAALRPLYATDPVLKAYLPVLGYLLGIRYPEAHLMEGDPRDVQQEIRIALTAFLRAAGEDHWSRTHLPMVVALEELHDVDERSLAALAVLLERLECTAPILFISSWRTDFRLPRELGLSVSLTELPLGPLSYDEASALMTSMLDGASLPPEMLRQVLTLTEGNPYYVEEVIHHLVDEKVLVKRKATWVVEGVLKEGSLPESLSGLILGRVDTLPRPVRNTLVHAAAIGVVFSSPLLVEVENRLGEPSPDAHLKVLVEGRFIRVAKAIRGGQSYAFRSLLTRQVVYDTLLPANKKLIHHIIGESLERVYEGNLQEHYKSLASHFAEAGEPGQAARYLALAGERAYREYNQALALELYQRYLPLGGVGPERDHVCWRLAQLLRRAGRPAEAVALLHQTLASLLSRGDSGDGRAMEVDLLLELGRVQRHLGQLSDAEATMEKAAQLCEQTRDRARLVDVRCAQAGVLRLLQRFPLARDLLVAAKTSLPGQGDPQREGRISSILGRLELDLANPQVALGHFRHALEQFRAGRDRWGEALELCHLAEAEFLMRRLDPCREFAMSSLALAEPMEMRSIVARARLLLGAVRALREDPLGVADMLSALAMTQQLGDVPRQVRSHQLIGSVFRDLKRVDDAFTHEQKARELRRGISTDVQG